MFHLILEKKKKVSNREDTKRQDSTENLIDHARLAGVPFFTMTLLCQIVKMLMLQL